MKVYLAGGMRGDWRNIVKELVPFATFIDPVEHGFVEPEEYTPWDLAGVRECDVVFAYLEKSNPSGLGMMLEIGYGKGLSKFVIFVDEKNERYTQIGRIAADVVYDSLRSGVEMLKALQLVYKG